MNGGREWVEIGDEHDESTRTKYEETKIGVGAQGAHRGE